MSQEFVASPPTDSNIRRRQRLGSQIRQVVAEADRLQETRTAFDLLIGQSGSLVGSVRLAVHRPSWVDSARWVPVEEKHVEAASEVEPARQSIDSIPSKAQVEQVGGLAAEDRSADHVAGVADRKSRNFDTVEQM